MYIYIYTYVHIYVVVVRGGSGPGQHTSLLARSLAVSQGGPRCIGPDVRAESYGVCDPVSAYRGTSPIIKRPTPQDPRHSPMVGFKGGAFSYG